MTMSGMKRGKYDWGGLGRGMLVLAAMGIVCWLLVEVIRHLQA